MKRQNLRKCEKGSVIVELAILTLVLASLALGFNYYANAIRKDIILQIAAREGARTYATTLSSGEAISAAYSELGEVDGATVTSFIDGYDRGVTAETSLSFYIPLAGDYNINLEKTSVFHVEPLLEDSEEEDDD